MKIMQPSNPQYPQFNQQTTGQYPPNFPSGQYPQTPGPFPPNGQSYPQTPPGYPQQLYPGQTPPPPGLSPMQQPPAKKKSRKGLFITLGVIIGAVVLCGVFAAGSHGTSNTGAAVNTSSSGNSSQQPAASTQHFKVGDTVKVGDTWQAVVNSAKTDFGGNFSALKSGDVYLIVDISVTNLSSTEQTISSIANFTLQDSTGQKYDETIDPSAGATLDGKVEAGQPLRGIIAFEVPSTTKQFTFNFEPDIMSSGQTTWDLSVP